MIITFSNKTKENDVITYWFEVKIPEHTWTSYCVGISEKGSISTSGPFKDLDKEMQDRVIEECRKMAAKMV